MKKNVTIIILLNFLFAIVSIHSLAQLPDTWVQKSNYGGIGSYGVVSFSIGSKGYIGTGNPTTKNLWEYDPATDSWSQKADFGGTARYYASGFSIGSKGYIGTGLDGIQRNDFWEYDQATNIWTQKADFGGIPRDAAVGFSIGSKGYMGTGELADAFNTKLNDFWEYDPATDTWTQKADVGAIGRSWAAGFSIGNKGYIGTGSTGVKSKDFFEYNPDTDTWTAKASFGGVGRFGAIGCGNGISGFIGLGDAIAGFSNDFWEYSPAMDTWTKRADFGGAIRTLATGFSINSRIYAGTGSDYPNNIKFNDFWEYTPTCVLPTITSQPVNQLINYGASASFTVGAADVVSYQWQEDPGSGFVDITDGGIYSNATTATLTLSMPTVDMSGFKYRCVLTGSCALVASTNGNATLTVASVPIMITPDAGQTKVYGSADPAPFTYSFAPALLGTDIISGLMERVAGENVGEYVFTPGTLTAGNNYTLTVAATHTFSITALPVVITPDAGQTKVYGSVDPAPFSYTLVPALVGTDIISGLMERVAGENVGSYSFLTGTLTAGLNYNLTIAATPTFEITPKALSITAENKEKCFDGAIYNDGYTVTYSGFENSENQTVLGGALVYGGTSASAINAGDYSIEPSGLSSGNYTIGYINGTLTINAIPSAPVIARIGDTLISNAATGNQWFKDGAEITGATNPKYLVTANGIYYSVSAQNGCTSLPSNSIAILDVSVKEVNAELFEIYPNPNRGVFSIRLKTAGNDVYNIEIYNSLGSLIWKQNNTQMDGNNAKAVDLASPKPGLYTVVLKNKTNTFIKKLFIVK